MKKNLLWAAAFGLLMSASLVSCDDDDPVIDNPDNPDDPNTPPTEEVVTTNGYYVLNSGKMGSNNASLSFYNTDTQEVTADVFMEKNERGLGDTANDMLIYGEKMYIAVYGSQVIEVTDLQGNSLKQIQSTTGSPLQPRFMTSHEGKVYVSLYDGYVARLDTASLEIETQVAVGRNLRNSWLWRMANSMWLIPEVWITIRRLATTRQSLLLIWLHSLRQRNWML